MKNEHDRDSRTNQFLFVIPREVKHAAQNEVHPFHFLKACAIPPNQQPNLDRDCTTLSRQLQIGQAVHHCGRRVLLVHKNQHLKQRRIVLGTIIGLGLENELVLENRFAPYQR
jgi:hypothetical protein